jgi:peptidoglycan/xylan/chitin deacetylase (PgdA/CDA1 family)
MKKFFAWVIFLAAAIFIFSITALPRAYDVPIFMYHNIDNVKDMLSVSPKNFERQMKFLKDRKYNTIGLNDLVSLIANNKKIPANTVLITFDDGYENLYTNAYPILKKYNISATMFIIVGNHDRPNYLNRQQLKELADNGIDMGDHTLNHAWLPTTDDKNLAVEISDSKKELESIIGKRVDFISYPLGGFDQRVRTAVMRAGYKAACATHPGRFSANNDLYALKRIKITNKDNGMMISYWFKATGYYTWFRDRTRKERMKK